jgi:hypothetical protein
LVFFKGEACTHTITHATYTIQHNLPVLKLQATAVILITIIFTLCNIYAPTNEPLDNTTLTNVLPQLATPLILVGDFNAHHLFWCSMYDDIGCDFIE